jgi:serine/threonine-protein kinase
VTPSAAAGRSDESQVVVQPLPRGDRKVVVRGFDGRYLPSGHLIYSVGGDVMSVAFDPSKLEMKGLPVPVIEGVRRNGSFSQFAVSHRGGLIFIPGEAGSDATRTVVALAERSGKIQKLALPPAAYEYPRISPDGKLLAVGVNNGSERFVSIYPLAGDKSPVRLTLGGGDTIPVWSPDSRYVYFRSDRDGRVGLFRQPADGSSDAERLTEAESLDIRHWPLSIDPFNKVLTFEFRRGPNDSDIWVLPLEGDRKPRPLLVRPYFQSHAVFSPNGKWLAYMSNELSTYGPQIFVEPYPSMGNRRQITMESGGEPLWSPDGKQLFYFWQPGLHVVDIQTEPQFSLGTTTLLPITGALQTTGRPRNYDINLTNPNQFVVVLLASQGENSQAPQSQINVVLNWVEELKRRVPVK